MFSFHHGENDREGLILPLKLYKNKEKFTKLGSKIKTVHFTDQVQLTF